MQIIRIIFFGSTNDSVIVLSKLFTINDLLFTTRICAVVTQPPKPVGRNKIITPTPVEVWAKTHSIPVTTMDAVAPFKPDLLVSASFGEKIPMEIIQHARYGGINVHPSLLPRWRGGDPVPWAILSGDHQIGVTISTLSETFDAGKIIAQKKYPITPHDTSGPLRTELFTIGAQLLVESLPDYLSGKNKGTEQQKGDEPYARRFTREDGFEPWERIIDPKESDRINRKFRALSPWPGLWTLLRQGSGGQGKRLKILGFTHMPTLVQLEGKTPIPWEQFTTAYFSP